MKKIFVTLLAVIMACSAYCQTVQSQEEPKGKAIFTIFSNFHAGLGDNNDAIGFELERSYLGYQYQFTKDISAKVVFDIGKSSDVSDLQRVAYVKNAMVSWKKGGLKINAGLTGLQQFDLQEKYWGHRYVMKSFQDEYKFGSSADLGVVAQYQFSSWLGADLTCVNGEGYKKIQLDNKMLYAAGLTLTPVKGLALRVYGDYKGIQNPDSTQCAQENLSFFAGYKTDGIAVGAEYNKLFNSRNAVSKHQNGISAYASCAMPYDFEIYARYDYLTSNDGWNAAKDGQFMLAGLQYTPCKNFRISPCFRMQVPKDENDKLKSSIYLYMEAKL